MERVIKLIYNSLLEASRQQQLHDKLTSNPAGLFTTTHLFDIPSWIRDEIMSTNSHYIPHRVVQPHKISSEVTSFSGVIPESGTRLDIYFLKGSHCVKGFDMTFVCRIVILYIMLIERLTSHRKNVRLVLLPTLFKKEYDHNRAQVFNTSNVNTGVTVWQASGEFIFVYRSEEMLKVILHELLHAYHFDYRESSNIACLYEENLKKKYKVQSKRLAMNEAFNDAVTLLLYLGVFIYNKQRASMATFETFKRAYQANYVHLSNYLARMSAKLHAYSRKHFNGVLHESTHVFAYYHAKAALFHNPSMFTFMLRNHFKVKDDKDNIMAYIRLVCNSLDRKAYKQKLDTLESNIHESSKQFLRSLRMSNFDLARKN